MDWELLFCFIFHVLSKQPPPKNNQTFFCFCFCTDRVNAWLYVSKSYFLRHKGWGGEPLLRVHLKKNSFGKCHRGPNFGSVTLYPMNRAGVANDPSVTHVLGLLRRSESRVKSPKRRSGNSCWRPCRVARFSSGHRPLIGWPLRAAWTFPRHKRFCLHSQLRHFITYSCFFVWVFSWFAYLCRKSR